MKHPHSWELWHEHVLDIDIGAWIPLLQGVEEVDNRVICIKIRTKSPLKRRMLSPVLEPGGDFCLDCLHFHSFALHYLIVKQPSNKCG